jgi:hypothetical protein
MVILSVGRPGSSTLIVYEPRPFGFLHTRIKTMAETDKSGKYTRGGISFDGYNKPKKTPSHPTKSHAVLAKEGDNIKLIRFGEQGTSGSPKKEGESTADRKRRESFKARHASNIKKGKMSAAYWADKVKW